MKLAVMILALAVVAFAQDIRLDNFIKEALQNNPRLKSIEKKVRVQKQVPSQVSALPDPVLGFTQWIQPVETRVGPQQNIFSLAQKIPFPGKLGLKEDIALQGVEVTRQDYEIARHDLVFVIKSNWYDLFLTDRSLAILDDYRLLLKDFVNAAAAKYATGQGIQAQVLKAQVEYSSIRVRLHDLSRKRSTLVSQLNQARHQAIDVDIQKVTLLDTSSHVSTQKELIEEALNKRPEIKSALARKEMAGFKKSLVHKNYLPDFTIQANYITVQDKNSPAPDAGTDAWSIMLGLNLPLWQAPRKAAVEQSQQQIFVEDARLEDIKTKIISEIHDLDFREKSIRETLMLYKTELLPQATNSLESAFSAYRSGTISFLDLLDAQRMLLQLRLTYVKEQVSYRKNSVALEKAVGRELTIDN
jgi:cobalt-zinc-cadmium efflux system outer membrane protein